MDRSQRKTLALFREVFDVTGILTDAQFGELIRAVAAYHFGMEAVPVEDPAVGMALGFLCAQVDRYEAHCGKNREAAKARYRKKHTAEESQAPETPEAENAAPEGAAKCSEIQQNAAQATEAPQGAAECSETQRKAAKGHSTSTSTSTSTSISTSMSTSLSAPKPSGRPPPAGHTEFPNNKGSSGQGEAFG